ncbi:MAG TPA: hypothetical protein VHJ34_04655, partial [Actinomycetota bacterium]|nr:hypothetical protein [Actinomycetota bacterium]
LGALVAYALAAAAWVALQGRVALRAAGAVPLPAGAAPRLENVAAGLAADLGAPAPRLYRAPGAGANALSCWAGGPALVVTDGLLERYTRTEIEAVVAHCLVRLERRRQRRAALATALGRAGRAVAPVTGGEDDGRAAALTRYPPALAVAIAKAEPRGGRFAPLWLVGDGARGPSPAARADALEDL